MATSRAHDDVRHSPQRSPRYAITLLLHRYRRPLAAVLAALAVLIGLSALRPAAAPTVEVTVAARDLAPGTVLRSADLTTALVDAALAGPFGTADIDALTGGMLATGVRTGEPITAGRLAVGVGATSLNPGEVAVAVRLVDAAMADVLAPGDHIDLVDSTGQTGQVIAANARVITVPRTQREGILSGGAGRADSLVLVATDRRSATRLAAAGLRGPLATMIRTTGDST